MSSPAMRLKVIKGAKKPIVSIYLVCHVKPGASAKREGIVAVNSDCIELCVAAQAKEGEANKAVRELIAEVLSVPKSDVEIAKGMKSREKTVAIHNVKPTGNEEEQMKGIRDILEKSIS